MMTKKDDPHNLDQRSLAQCSRLLERIEQEDDSITTPQIISTLKMVVSVRVALHNLQAKADEPDAAAGSTVRKYSGAFKASDASSKRKAGSRRTPVIAFDADDDDPDNAAD